MPRKRKNTELPLDGNDKEKSSLESDSKMVKKTETFPIANKDGLFTFESIKKTLPLDTADAIINMCEKSSEDDPPMVFLWRNLDNFVANIHNATVAPPFPLPNPLTTERFKEALLEYVHIPGAADPEYNAVLPCTVLQLALTSNSLGWLCTDPWIIQVAGDGGNAVLPLAMVVSPIPRSSKMGIIARSHPGHPILWG